MDWTHLLPTSHCISTGISEVRLPSPARSDLRHFVRPSCSAKSRSFLSLFLPGDPLLFICGALRNRRDRYRHRDSAALCRHGHGQHGRLRDRSRSAESSSTPTTDGWTRVRCARPRRLRQSWRRDFPPRPSSPSCALLPFVGGVAGMRFQIVLFVVAGAALWVVTLVVAGYYFGPSRSSAIT